MRNGHDFTRYGDVTSYIIKDLPVAAVFRPIVFGKRVAISFMTFAEIQEGIHRSNWGNGNHL